MTEGNHPCLSHLTAPKPGFGDVETASGEERESPLADLAIVLRVVPIRPDVFNMLGEAAAKLAGGKALVIGYTADGELYCDSTITSGPETVFALEWAKTLAMHATIVEG
jgi:hypothetical protein